jgi:hypothetical protein
MKKRDKNRNFWEYWHAFQGCRIAFSGIEIESSQSFGMNFETVRIALIVGTTVQLYRFLVFSEAHK